MFQVSYQQEIIPIQMPAYTSQYIIKSLQVKFKRYAM